MKYIEQYLQVNGPSLSSDVARYLVDSQGIAPTSARQRISRAEPPVRRLEGIKLRNKEKFLYLDGQFGSVTFYKNLVEALNATGSAYGRALGALQTRSGAIWTKHFPIASGLAVDIARGQLLHSDVESVLESLSLIHRVMEPDGEVICLKDIEGLTARRRAALITEDIILGAIRNWLIKTGWSSTNALQIRSRESYAKIGQFAWDFAGPCYLAGIRNTTADTVENGFIMGEIVLGRKLLLRDLRPFFSKWDALQAQMRRQRLQPILITESLGRDCMDALRKRGAMIAIPSVLFGEEMANDLKELRSILENTAAAIASDSTKVFEIFNRLAKLEGAAGNLRGVVIEMLIAHLYKRDGYDIDIRKKVRGNDSIPAEIDVKACTKSETVCCECKGVGPRVLVDVAEINDWLDRSLPRIKQWISQRETRPPVSRFEFYASTDYTIRARELITNVEAMHVKQPIKFFNGQDIMDKLRARNESSLLDIFREQFLCR